MSGINKSIDHGKGSSNATLLEKKIGFKKRTIDEINDDIDKTKNDIEECAALSAAMRKKRSTVEESAIPIVKEAFEEIENDIWAIPAHYIRLEKLTYSVNFLSSTLYPPNI